MTLTRAIQLCLDLLLVLILVGIIWIISTGGTKLEVGNVVIGLRSPKNPAILFFSLLGIRLYFFGGIRHLHHSKSIRELSYIGLLFFISSVVVVKTFVSLVADFHFRRVLDNEDWMHTYMPDLAIAFYAAVAIFVGALLLRYANKSKALLLTSNIFLLFVFIVLLGVGTLYILLGYAYFEWGSFLEPQHFEAVRMAGVGPEFFDLFFRWRTLVALAVIIGLYLTSKWLHQSIVQYSPQGIVSALLVTALLASTLVAATAVNNNPRKFAPSVQSPLLMLLKPIAGNAAGLQKEFLAGIKPTDFMAEPDKEIQPQYTKLAGIAKGKNVIFFIMESVRRRSVGLYGYQRDTMPTLSALAQNSIVFDQAYVMQPRSSKAMAALAYGVMPDPRLRPLAWEHKRAFGYDSIFNRLINNGKKFYIGTGQPYGGDNLQRFFNATSDNRADRITAFEEIKADPELQNDDRGLSQDFLNWTKDVQNGYVALLWTECAHMPYHTEQTPFGQTYLNDRYDNCLLQVDDSLKVLVDGLKESGQLDDTLLVILGDHGEALGEKFDRGHGNYLYQHSLRVPFIIYNPNLFESRIDVSARFQLKDVPSTLLYLLGEPSEINQSVNIFSKGDADQLYLSNVYQDFKLGMITDQTKFVYRPTYDISYVFDLDADPNENVNIVNRYSKAELKAMKRKVLVWYRYQTHYIEEHFPKNKQSNNG